jgi:hypothetical protein
MSLAQKVPRKAVNCTKIQYCTWQSLENVHNREDGVKKQIEEMVWILNITSCPMVFDSWNGDYGVGFASSRDHSVNGVFLDAAAFDGSSFVCDG